MTWRTLVCVLLLPSLPLQQQRIGSITQNGVCNIAGITGSNVTVNCVPARALERIQEGLAELVKQHKITADQATTQVNTSSCKTSPT